MGCRQTLKASSRRHLARISSTFPAADRVTPALRNLLPARHHLDPGNRRRSVATRQESCDCVVCSRPIRTSYHFNLCPVDKMHLAIGQDGHCRPCGQTFPMRTYDVQPYTFIEEISNSTHKFEMIYGSYSCVSDTIVQLLPFDHIYLPAHSILSNIIKWL